MTFIYNAGLGELLDRLSIVTRKIVELGPGVSEAGAPQELVEEADALCAELVRQQKAKAEDGRLLYYGFLLGGVNGALWERENRLREIKARVKSALIQDNAAAASFALIAAQIAALNDRRRSLIATLSGKNTDPKIYS